MGLHIITINTIADLKLQSPSTDAVVLVMGQTTKADGRGGFYQWDSVDTTTEDTKYYNVVKVTSITTGRWKRVNVRMLELPHGNLVFNGGMKTFYTSGTLDANGRVTINLTYENTAGGTAIFSEIWFNTCQAKPVGATDNDLINGQPETQAANLKTCTYSFGRGNTVTLNLGIVTAGLNLLGLRSAATGTQVLIKVEGI